MNNEPLSVDHGFPLRIIVPGHVGGRMVKWLARIHVSDIESTNYYHIHDNRLLPSHVDAEKATAENWWSKPEFAIQELNVNSVVLAPAHGEQLDLSGDDFYTISGYAYSGGGRKVIRVELTLNDGKSWQDCRIIYTEKPNAYGKMWCWVQYELRVPVASLLRSKEICVRAWDASMNTQPEFPTWNVMGMMNNPWFRVRVHGVNGGAEALTFEHPTNSGSLKGGWMTPERIPTEEVTSKNEIEEEPSTDDGAHVSVRQQQQRLSDAAKKLPVFTLSEIAVHNSKESCWFIVRGLVFDATPFLNEHPGGAASILLCGGTDCTEEFESIHSTKAWGMLAPYCIGRCEQQQQHDDDASTTGSNEETASEEDDETAVALSGSHKVPLVLIGKQIVSHDTRIFRFALPAKHLTLGLPTGNHVLLYGKVRGKTVVRAYTPISDNDEQGFVSFLIKVYFAGENPAHVEGGIFSQYLDDLHLGSRIEMRGPLGHFTYQGLGRCVVNERPVQVKKLGFIAGGTGITPIFQIMRAILSAPDDTTVVALIYCVRGEKDLLLKDEIDALQKLKPSQCRVFYTLTELVADEAPHWRQGRTRLTVDMVRQVIGENADHVALCGPPGLLEHACLPALAKLGYDCADQVTQL
jgi:nitrate reductase (NAD(P)H)